MPFHGDPQELDRLAARLAGTADAVRVRAGDVRSQARSMRWVGPAADACRARIEEEVGRLDAAAGRLDEAAAAMRRHADEVREGLARIRAVEVAVTDWLSVAGPSWRGWRWGPGALPVSGSLEWLEVGDDLRRLGVGVW